LRRDGNDYVKRISFDLKDPTVSARPSWPTFSAGDARNAAAAAAGAAVVEEVTVGCGATSTLLRRGVPRETNLARRTVLAVGQKIDEDGHVFPSTVLPATECRRRVSSGPR